MGVDVFNRANATGDHDGLVVSAALTCNGLLKDPEIPTQVRATKLVIKSGTTQWAIDHDL